MPHVSYWEVAFQVALVQVQAVQAVEVGHQFPEGPDQRFVQPASAAASLLCAVLSAVPVGLLLPADLDPEQLRDIQLQFRLTDLAPEHYIIIRCPML